MYRIDNSSAALALPTPGSVGPNPNGYFTGGNPATNTPATVVDADWANAVQEEICNVIAGAGVTLDKTKQNQLLAAIQKLGRIKLTANLNLYVATTGSDTNNTGLSSGSPFLTIGHAVSVALNGYDAGGYTITINVAAGTYTEAVLVAGQVPGSVSNPSSLVIKGASSSTTTITYASSATVTATYGASVEITGVTVTNTGANNAAVLAERAGIVTIGADVVVNSTGGGQASALTAHIHAEIDVASNLTVGSVSGAGVFAASLGGVLTASGIGVTVTGTVTVSGGFVTTSQLGALYMLTCTFTGGTVTGDRYYADTNSVIVTGGGGASYFPGSVAGSTATGGQYS